MSKKSVDKILTTTAHTEGIVRLLSVPAQLDIFGLGWLPTEDTGFHKHTFSPE